MASFPTKPCLLLAFYPPLPLHAEHWQATIAAMGLSDQQAKVVELVLRDLGDMEIAVVMGLGEGTVKDYLKRIYRRTGMRGRMQLATHVLALSHQVRNDGQHHLTG